ncbi:hypothetical protein PGRAN_11383 [Listeria grandensis FSL F6-0971]|uniref:Uncharacterized protein n=1 Tax=Listeria grandensis FSL F6-0971 TaxID=1265819 RepID=W7B6S5_9LIST|nr:hypothetical protein [Listeria grandensis]EUJ22994.1 hypothetical protein PGRAN_11383 [Listeria grandensis FSL F6-0971]
MNQYRTLIYENIAGERIDLTVPQAHFLYELTGAGFSYTNEVSESNYTDKLDVDSTSLQHADITGLLEIRDAINSNRSIYEKQERIATILNYDQLIRKATGEETHGKLLYKNDTGIEVYLPVLIANYEFGEITVEEEILHVLEVTISFTRLSKTWLATTPQVIVFSLQGTDESHFHRYKHPWQHGEVFEAGNGSIATIGGNDLAKLIVKVYGEVSTFTMRIKDALSGMIKTIKYDANVFDNEVLIINNFDLSTTKNGVNVIRDFDLFLGRCPIF